MTDNEKAIRAFCLQFTPPLRYVRTERVNMVAIPDAWQTSLWDKTTGIGITVVAYMGGLHAYLEAAGPGVQIAENAGRVMAKALGLFRETGHGGGSVDDI